MCFLWQHLPEYLSKSLISPLKILPESEDHTIINSLTVTAAKVCLTKPLG